MKWIGVITGDIVGSSKILEDGDRDRLLEVMYQTIEDIKARQGWMEIKLEVSRGDSFQLLSPYPSSTFIFAVMLRAHIIANSSKNTRWDARLGVGIGKGEYLTTSIRESDGEAFHLAGKAFDSLDRNSRLVTLTPEEDFNNELKISSAFADDIISNWTPTQARICYEMGIKMKIQKEIAQSENSTPQNISRIHSAGKIALIANYLKRCGDKISTLNPQTPPLP